MAAYDDINPPAIVRQAEESINSLRDKIKNNWHKYENARKEFAYEGKSMGEIMLALQTKLPKGQFKAYVEANFTCTYNHARRLIRLARVGKTERAHALADDSLDANLERNLKILCEDDPEQEVTSNQTVPFPTGGQTPPAAQKPPETPLREPGDETAYDDLAARIQAILCPSCKRKGLSCDKCRAKVYSIEHGHDEPKPPAPKPGRFTRPQDSPGSALKPGEVIVNWPEFHNHSSGMLIFIQKMFAASSVQAEFSPRKAGLDRRIEELVKDVKKEYEAIFKQKAPLVAPGVDL